MKNTLALALASAAMIVAPSMALAYDSNEHPGAKAFERAALVTSAVVQAPLWVIGDTLNEAYNMADKNDNVLLVVPGALQGLGLGVADAVTSPIDACKGVDSTYLAKNFDK